MSLSLGSSHLRAVPSALPASGGGMACPQGDQTFYEDSSTQLGLDHKAVAGALPGSRRLAAVGGIEKHFGPQEAEHRRVQQQLFDKRIRQLMDDGCTLAQAKKLAQAERDDPTILRQLRDFEGDQKRKYEFLMGVFRHVDGGSSGAKSKFKSRKTGTHVCPNCHLEGCQCYGGPGRPFMNGHGRTEDVSCKVTAGAREQLRDDKISAGKVVQMVVERAQELGLSVGDYLGLIGAANIEDVANRLRRPAPP